MELFVMLGLIEYFLFHVGEIFNYNLFKDFLIPFLFFSSSGTPIMWMLVHLTLPQWSLRLSSVLFHSFYFILLFSNHFYHFIFHPTDSFFCFRYLAMIPFRVFLILVIMLFVIVCLFFNSRSLLIDSCIYFSILFLRLLIIFTIIFWILFQIVCLFPLHLFWLLCF